MFVGFTADALLHGNIMETMLARQLLSKADRVQAPAAIQGSCHQLATRPFTAAQLATKRARMKQLLSAQFGPFFPALLENSEYVLEVLATIDVLFYDELLLKALKAGGFTFDVGCKARCKRYKANGLTTFDPAKKAITMIVDPENAVFQANRQHVDACGRLVKVSAEDFAMQTLEHESIHVLMHALCPAFIRRNASNLPKSALARPSTSHSNVFGAIAKARFGHVDFVTMHVGSKEPRRRRRKTAPSVKKQKTKKKKKKKNGKSVLKLPRLSFSFVAPHSRSLRRQRRKL